MLNETQQRKVEIKKDFEKQFEKWDKILLFQDSSAPIKDFRSDQKCFDILASFIHNFPGIVSKMRSKRFYLCIQMCKVYEEVCQYYLQSLSKRYLDQLEKYCHNIIIDYFQNPKTRLQNVVRRKLRKQFFLGLVFFFPIFILVSFLLCLVYLMSFIYDKICFNCIKKKIKNALYMVECGKKLLVYLRKFKGNYWRKMKLFF